MSLLQVLLVILSALLYFSFFWLNEWLFGMTALHDGANWVFLPAGLRLLCTLLFAGEGAIGVLLASLLIVYIRGGEMDPLTQFGAAFISAGAPYLAYRAALKLGLSSSLERLSAGGLGILALIYALASSFLHSFWFAARGFFTDFAHGWSVMFIGDLIGTLILAYLMKMALAVLRRTRPTS